MATTTVSDDIPQWKKDLIARLRNQNKKNEERLWIDHHTPHPVHNHPHPKTELVYPPSPENGFDKDRQSAESSDSEDLHYGPGIVNKLRNKYLSLALRETNNRPTILRKATSLENLLDEEEGEECEKGDERLFRRRGGGNDGGSHLKHYRSTSRRQEMKRARSVEVISRASHDDELTMTLSVTTKINNRQSLHEDMLINNQIEKNDEVVENVRIFQKSTENGVEEPMHKFSGRINRPKRIPPLLNEKEKPPIDVVKHAKMIFEKRPEQRTKKPPHTGDVAAKVDSFNNIIVKAKVASKAAKQSIKHIKPAISEKPKHHQHHVRPVAKPVILNEEITKPRSLDLKGPKNGKKDFSSLPSPIPDVSRVDIKSQDGKDPRNNAIGHSHLCETPDLILTSSPLPKITSPTYKRASTEHFIAEERNCAFVGSPDALNRYIASPVHSPIKIHFNKDEVGDAKTISPISPGNVTKNSASSVFNFVNSQVDQKHLPTVNKNVSEQKVPVSEPLKIEVNGFNSNKVRMGLSAFEIEKNHKNIVKSGGDGEKLTVKSSGESKKAEKESAETVCDGTKSKEVNGVGETVKVVENISNDVFGTGCGEKFSELENCSEIKSVDGETTNNSAEQSVSTTNVFGADKIVRSQEKTFRDVDKIGKIDRSVLKPVHSVSDKNRTNDDGQIKIAFPKKSKPRMEESNTAVFNFTARKDVPDYIANDKSRSPSRPTIPKPDESGIIILSEALLPNFKELQEVLEEDELIKSLEARPPSPCDVTFINDNILIDGKSSLIQPCTRRMKLKISFVDGADIYEYPSETSLLLEDSPLPSPIGSSAQVGHTVPSLSGSSLATYTPKTTEEFQLGVTRTIQHSPTPPKPDVTDVPEPSSDVILEEVEQPILFSSGGTSDILF